MDVGHKKLLYSSYFINLFRVLKETPNHNNGGQLDFFFFLSTFHRPGNLVVERNNNSHADIKFSTFFLLLNI